MLIESDYLRVSVRAPGQRNVSHAIGYLARFPSWMVMFDPMRDYDRSVEGLSRTAPASSKEGCCFLTRETITAWLDKIRCDFMTARQKG